MSLIWGCCGEVEPQDHTLRSGGQRDSRYLGGQIRLHASANGAERFLMAELSGDYSGLVRLVCGPKLNLVAVTRIERVTRGL